MDSHRLKPHAKRLEIFEWGQLHYGKALRRQKALVEERISGTSPDRLVFVEHPPVVTLGRSGGLKDLRITREDLYQRGIALYNTDRGGMATFHGPGQLVAYPILKLDHGDLQYYLRLLQETLTTMLRSYGLQAELQDGQPGVWVHSAKLASIGIAVRRWVSYHGVALNVNIDTQWFNWIIPCGHPDEKITSMKRELGYSLDLAEVSKRFMETFRRLFGYRETEHILGEPLRRGANP